LINDNTKNLPHGIGLGAKRGYGAGGKFGKEIQ